VRIREAQGADAEAVAALLAELGYPNAPDRVAERIERFAGEPASRFLVADGGNHLLGFASATIMPLAHEAGSWCRLSALIVAQSRRRSGVGRALVETVETWAGVEGCRYVEVTSGERPEREAAHRFYERLGYEPTSKRYLKELT
jgi:GNAT superfamily N-acetyltransferase